MGISKVVYGTTVLVDLTADTVDASHLAKGYTAHDASGNAIVGTLQPQTDSNLLNGVTPKLLNGTTQSGKTYVIPASGNQEKAYIEYQLNLPTLAVDTTYRVSAFCKAHVDDSSFAVLAPSVLVPYIYYQKKDGRTYAEIQSPEALGCTNSLGSRAAYIKCPAGCKPLELGLSSPSNQASISISDIVLNAFAD